MRMISLEKALTNGMSIHHRQMNIKKWLPFGLFMLALLVRAFTFFFQYRQLGYLENPYMNSDSVAYLDWAREISEKGFRYFIDNAATPWYWLYPLFLALVSGLDPVVWLLKSVSELTICRLRSSGFTGCFNL